MAARLDWDQLRIFLAAARAGSLRGASEDLGVNHATVNRAVRRLEETLGTRVFDRSAGGLTLTQPGELLIPYSEEIERQTHKIERGLTGLDTTPSGTVRVSMPPSFAQGFFAPVLHGFSAEFPDIEIEVIPTNAISDLRRHEADVSIRAAFEVDDDVVGRRLTRYVVAAFASPAYLDGHPDLRVGDGDGAHWVGWGGKADWVKETPYPNATVRHALPEIQMQAEAAAAGLGMVWCPAFLLDPEPRLIRIPGAPIQASRSIWVLLHGDLRKTARVRAFVDFFSDYITERRAQFIR